LVAPRSDDVVRVHLERLDARPTVVSFGLPLLPGVTADPSRVTVRASGQALPAKVRPILYDYDAQGRRARMRSLLIQFPASALTGPSLDVDVDLRGEPKNVAGDVVPFASPEATFESPELVDTATRSIASNAGGARLVERGRTTKTLFVAREPAVLATYPAGYLAQTEILGKLAVASGQLPAELGGIRFFEKALLDFTRSAMYEAPYAVDPEAVVDPTKSYEGWLYDRCATYLMAHAVGGDTRILRHALRTCSYYGQTMRRTGSNAGTFPGKPEVDPKYSHARGLYAYFALTGDETALASAVAVAHMWERDSKFVIPYRKGHLLGPDKLWTERLLAASLSGLYYGYELTGDPELLAALRELFETAYRHITGDAAVLSTINPGHAFPPQNCFVHSAKQHDEGEPREPWCSGWMSELLVDPLLRYGALTGDDRVAEIFVRLTRFLRDVGSAYFVDDVRDDSFLLPLDCYAPGRDKPRMLVPLYGAGLMPGGKRAAYGEYSDFEHCPDATALAAAGLWALRKTGRYDQGGPIGPFANEGESFAQLHQELAFCASRVFEDRTRPRRDPSAWTSGDLAKGAPDPARFIRDNEIGWPVFQIAPARKLSWWFNQSMLQFALLEEAKVAVPGLGPGRVQPRRGCR
jgi:hypothetical protein